MKQLHIIVGVAVCVLASDPAAGGVFNGGFEASPDLADWTVVGPAFKRDREISRDFLPPIAPDWTPTEGEYFASLWSTDQQGNDHAGLVTTFTASAGEVLSFDYFFDFGDVALYRDTARIWVTWANGTLEEDLVEHNTPGHELADDENIDWTTVEWELPADGEYMLGFLASDATGDFESILGVDDVRIIPEPSCALLLCVGTLSMLFRRRG
jgi:hypothetical protein